jgi:hypothetical protein
MCLLQHPENGVDNIADAFQQNGKEKKAENLYPCLLKYGFFNLLRTNNQR